MSIRINFLYRYRRRYFFNLVDYFKEDFQKKFSIDKTYNIFDIKVELVIYFFKKESYYNSNETIISKFIVFNNDVRDVKVNYFRRRVKVNYNFRYF